MNEAVVVQHRRDRVEGIPQREGRMKGALFWILGTLVAGCSDFFQ